MQCLNRLAAVVCLALVSPTLIAAERDESQKLEEVVVTAQKKEERLQDVPVPVTAIDADALADTNETRLQDFYAQVPGLSWATSLEGTPVLAIRGLITGTDALNPTVSILVDDIPYGATTQLGGGGFAPDFDPSELERIEVLRGPQGTLYGASSLGGLIKYVTTAPSTAGVSGRLLVGTSSINGSSSLGYNARGSLNVPLSDTVAILGSVFTHEDPGYIDNVLTGEKDVNGVRSSGARLSALWQPSEKFSLRLSGFYQDTKVSGTSQLQPDLGDLKQSYMRGAGVLHRTYEVFSATIKAKLGTADLTSITAYNAGKLASSLDYNSFGFAGFLNDNTELAFPNVPNGTAGTMILDDNKPSKFTQELRLLAPIGQRVDWLLGAFYTHEHNPWTQSLAATDPLSGETLGIWETFAWVVDYTEYAAFTNLTLRFTDAFDVQIGGRQSRIEQSYHEVDTGPLYLISGLPSPLEIPQVDTTDHPFTYLVTPRLKLSPDLMVYARFASGYRPGGPNSAASPFGAPLTFKPDKTQNYELGMKGDVLGNVLSFDASLYYIDWKDIQIAFSPNGLVYNGNGGRAKSEGVELSIQWRPSTGLAVSSWVSFDNAVLTENPPPNANFVGKSGDRLPLSSRFTGNVAIDYTHSIAERTSGFVGGSVSYVGDRVGNFLNLGCSPCDRSISPSYTKVDLRGGVNHGPWTATLFVTNVADKRGVLYNNSIVGAGGPATIYIQPRTIGLSLNWAF